MLSGAVLGFDLYPVAFDSQGRATDYQVRVTARVALKTLPGRAGRSGRTRPSPSGTTTSSRATAASYVDRENDAIDRVADRFAQSLVTSMLEGF